jgi:hypothetical protein
MEEIVNKWIVDMLDEAITDSMGAIRNERLWQKGASNDEEIATHEFNIICNEHFIEKLEEMKSAYTK